MKKALVILTTYFRHLATSSAKFVVSAVKREHRALNENTIAGTDKSEPQKLIPPPLPKGAEGRGEQVNIDDDKFEAHDFEASTPHPDLPPAWANRGSRDRAVPSVAAEYPTSNIERSTSDDRGAIPGSAGVSQARFATGERDARVPRGNMNANSPALSPLRTDANAALTSASNSNFITRDELKRELNSLRRLIESRK